MVDMRERLKGLKADYLTDNRDDVLRYSAKIAEIKYTDMQNILLSYDEFNMQTVIVQGAIVDIRLEDGFIGVALKPIIYNYSDVAIACKIERTDENISKLKNKILDDVIRVKGVVRVVNSGSYISKGEVVE